MPETDAAPLVFDARCAPRRVMGLFTVKWVSLVLHALDPDLVRVDLLPDADLHPTPSGEDPYGPGRHASDHPLHGVFGADPRHLDVAAAQPLLDHLVRWAASLSD